MERYKNLSGDSGVETFEIGDSYINVKFSNASKIYKYSYNGSAGFTHVENMKDLASEGRWLNTYIKDYAKNLFDR